MKITKLLKTASRPSFWPAMRLGVLPTWEHEPAFAGLSFGTVIDVGANRGQFSMFSRYMWPDSRIIAFEPQPDQAETWRKLNIDNACLMEMALGAEASQTELHIASRKDSSSLLPLGDRQKQLFNMDEVGTITVDVMRLDNVLGAEDLSGPTLMKIDVQGFEYEVLEGATALFPHIDYLYLELSLVELYVGQKLYDEVKAFLSSHGYEESEMNRVNMTQDVQFDAIFRRR